MSMMMTVPMMIMMEMKMSSSPMKILVLILLMSWTTTIIMMLSGMEVWPMIFLIMLFNGGLMIMYLFVISMLPKEKKSFSQTTILQPLSITILSATMINKSKMTFNEMFKLSTWLIMSAIMMVMMVSMFVFILMMDPFKTMKSSF